MTRSDCQVTCAVSPGCVFGVPASKYHRQRGFTLVELVVVVLIVALLLLVSLPAYQAQLRQTRRSLGAAELLDARMRQEQFFVSHKRYASTLTELDYPASPYGLDAQGNRGAATLADRIYLIDLATAPLSYTLYAIPQLNQARDHPCGTLSVDSLGTKGVSGSKDVRDCW